VQVNGKVRDTVPVPLGILAKRSRRKGLGGQGKGLCFRKKD